MARLGHGLDVDAPALQLARQACVIVGQGLLQLLVFRADQVGGIAKVMAYLEKVTALPASTLRKFPVDLAERSEAKK